MGKLFTLLTSLFLVSCSAHYHVVRAMKKGYVCGQESDTIRITSIDSIPYVLNDSIYWERIVVQKDTIVRYKASFVPKTRFQTRIEYRYKTKVVKADVLKVKYKNKYITKYKTRWLFVIIAFVLGLLVKLSFSETFRSRIKLLFKLIK
jgi:hypothetical protein